MSTATHLLCVAYRDECQLRVWLAVASELSVRPTQERWPCQSASCNLDKRQSIVVPSDSFRMTDFRQATGPFRVSMPQAEGLKPPVDPD